jgi:hypothetical protein
MKSIKAIRRNRKVAIEGVKLAPNQRTQLQAIARTAGLSVDDVAAVIVASYVLKRNSN